MLDRNGTETFTLGSVSFVCLYSVYEIIFCCIQNLVSMPYKLLSTWGQMEDTKKQINGGFLCQTSRLA
ncbi:hypothetical protein MUB16_23505 [Priestia sp. OVL9]|nr:hypothetical protein [Priestia sp. OVL9]